MPKQIGPQIAHLHHHQTRGAAPIKILPQLRELGFELNELEEPTPEMVFGDEEFKLFTSSLDIVYKITFPKEVLEKIK